MAVSSSTDFSMTANDLITAALELLGVRAEEEPLQAFELERGLRWLNIMLKAWEADGVMAWLKTEGTLSLTQGTASYTFGSGGDFTTVPMDIEDMRIARTTDLPMTPLSRADYFAIPNKTTQGYPTQYYYDRQRDSGTLYVWPTADATLGTLKLTYRRRIADMTAATNNFDLPQEWYAALTYGLAARLIPIYGKSGSPRGAEIRQEFSAAYESLKAFDMAEGESSIFALPAEHQRPR